MIVKILIIQAGVFGVLSAIVANDKYRDPIRWGVLGSLLGPFGLVAAVAVGVGKELQSSTRQKSQPSDLREFDPEEHEKKCPDCAEYIKLEARVCKHCGHEFSDKDVEQQIEEKKQEVKQSARPARKVSPSHRREKEGALRERIVFIVVVIVLVAVTALAVGLLVESLVLRV